MKPLRLWCAEEGGGGRSGGRGGAHTNSVLRAASLRNQLTQYVRFPCDNLVVEVYVSK